MGSAKNNIKIFIAILMYLTLGHVLQKWAKAQARKRVAKCMLWRCSCIHPNLVQNFWIIYAVSGFLAVVIVVVWLLLKALNRIYRCFRKIFTKVNIRKCMNYIGEVILYRPKTFLGLSSYIPIYYVIRKWIEIEILDAWKSKPWNIRRGCVSWMDWRSEAEPGQMCMLIYLGFGCLVVFGTLIWKLVEAIDQVFGYCSRLKIQIHKRKGDSVLSQSQHLEIEDGQHHELEDFKLKMFESKRIQLNKLFEM